METLGNEIKQISAMKYQCIYCDYYTDRKSNYESHLNSLKHTKNVKMETLGNNIKQNKQNYVCNNCNKEFANRSGLWKHKQKCNKNEKDDKDISDKDLIIMLINDNKELRNLLIEQSKEKDEFKNLMMKVIENGTTNNSHNTTTMNSHNKAFNLNFYLNETCKNAMNITDFVEQLSVSIKDLEETGRLGYSEGISRIFINGLKQMSVTDRPIHCSDAKRETLYIKDNNEWNKEDEHKKILTNAIKKVTNKNIKQIFEWTKENPEYNDPTTKVNDKYLKIVSEAMSGSSEEETNKNYSKIIKNIAKETIIDK